METIVFLLFVYLAIGTSLSVVVCVTWRREGYRFGKKNWIRGVLFWLPLYVVNTVRDLSK